MKRTILDYLLIIHVYYQNMLLIASESYDELGYKPTKKKSKKYLFI